MRKYDPRILARWTAQIFESCSVPPVDAATAAQVLVRSEMRGYGTHGLTRVASYVERLRSGDFNPCPRMDHHGGVGGIVLDADGAMGQVAAARAVDLGLAALVASASVLITIRSCGHLGALGAYALLAAEAGTFCMVGQRTPPILAMPGYMGAAIGHNPIAFGCPAPNGPPIVFDVACSVAARGHILLAAREGRAIPAGWALDKTGNPTTDAKAALEGTLLPMGGHKGIGIAMLVECLAGAMAASPASLAPGRDNIKESGAVGRQGAFVWLVKPGAFAEQEDFGRYMIEWTRTYLDTGARMPGHRGDQLERAARVEGLALNEALEKELGFLGASLGIPFPSTGTTA